MNDSKATDDVDLLRLIRLDALMAETAGRPEVVIGLVDGPVRMDHPSLSAERLRPLGPRTQLQCHGGAACDHGTFIAGILVARRAVSALGVCRDCTVLLRPIFAEHRGAAGADAEDLAAAIIECVDAGARLVNLSVAVRATTERGRARLGAALDHAAKREVVVLAAAGNDAEVTASIVTAHPWVVPVVAYDRGGRPLPYSNIGRSIGRYGVGAPGDQLWGLSAKGERRTAGGTSAATAFVTGAAALLWSLFPRAPGSSLRSAITGAARSRAPLVPGLFDALAARGQLSSMST